MLQRRLLIFLVWLSMLLAVLNTGPNTAQYHVPSYFGATNRFEKADSVYGVFGDINFPFDIEPDTYHRIYIMEGQYYEQDYSYISLGWYKHPGIGVYYSPLYFWKKPIACGSCYGSDALLVSFFSGQPHNYGIIYVPTSNLLELYFDGILQRIIPATEMINIADAAIAGSWAGPHLPNRRIGVTFYNLQWVKRKPTNGNLVRKAWPWSILDLRVGPYACYVSSTNSFTCDETF